MGDTCSKVDDLEDEEAAAREEQKPQDGTAVRHHGKRRNSSIRRSLSLWSSKILKPNSSASPHRASNYNRLHWAVAEKFAASERDSNSPLPLGVVGLRNLGNTCFLNSSLQCLSATIPLTDYFLGYDYKMEINSGNPLGTCGKLATAYADLIKNMWSGKSAVLKPTTLKSHLERFAPQFVGHHQHDAQELLAYLLDGIHEDLNRIKGKKPYIEDRDLDGTNDEQDAIEAWKNHLRRDKSLVVDIFQGQLRQKLQCLHCGHTNTRFEAFMYLSLPISQSCRTLRDCLELYLAEERLTGENQWYCAKCKEHRDATKKTDLWILPPILIVHLKRFSFNEFGRMAGSKKNDVSIDYPLQSWDLSGFVCSRGAERPLYDCYAVSNHMGGLGGGHYTAFTLNRFDDQWYDLNDSTTRPVGVDTLHRHRASAYVLFYNRSSLSQDANLDGPLEDRAPLIRRQSVSRPDLWPHTQVQDSNFRTFTRASSRATSPPPLGGGDSYES